MTEDLARVASALVTCVALHACREVAAASILPVISIVASDPAGTRVVVEARGATCRSGAVPERVGRSMLVLRRNVDGSVPIVGEYSCDRGALRFRPAISLVAGETYVARVLGTRGAMQRFTIRRPERPADALRVVSVLPAAGVLPANLLRLYVTFSRPMVGEDDVERRFELRRMGRADPVAGPWRTTNLWSRDRRTLTLLFHPGRQKRGVTFSSQMEPLLVPGGRYAIVARGLQSVDGDELAETVVKQFDVGADDREPPMPSRISAPAGATRDFIEVEFADVLDSGRAAQSIHVLRADGTLVAGQGMLRADERALQWRASDAWVPGAYTVRISPDLEDLAGNAPRRLFDAAAPPSRGDALALRFVVTTER